MKQALLLVDHGSRRDEANQFLSSVVPLLSEARPELIVEYAHMELAEPTIAQGIATCVARGCESLVVFPYMVTPGRHVREDIPALVQEAAVQYPHINVTISDSFGLHIGLIEIILERCKL